MKTRKILALVLALVTLFSCLGLTAFADADPDACTTCGGDGKTGDNNDETCTACFGTGKLAYLDLETSETYSNTKEIVQNYDATVTENKTDVTKVQVSWTLTDISASVTMNKIWDPDKLEWADVNDGKDNTATAEDVTATFNFKNLSSVKINAQVAFEAETGITSEATYVDNGTTGDGKITLDSKALNANATLTGNVVVTVPADTDYFKTLTADATDAKYGTYTVTITAAPAVTANYLTFTANQANSSVTPSFSSGTWQYSTNDGKTWIDGTNDGTTTITLTNAGDKVMLKGTNCITDDYNYFSMTGSIAASGDVTSLTNGIGGDIALIVSCYQCMFYECGSLTSAPNLPSTTLAKYCYCNMFSNCESLTTAPALPATTLAEACYMFMFANCESLTTAPALPAGVNGVGSLAVECYYGMFTYCYKLENAPALGATTLTKGCYNAMFNRCTSLTYAPSLPATTLVSECYYQMFDGCTKLKVATSGSESNKIFTCPDTTGLEDPLTDMFDYTMGTFTGTPTTGTTYYWYTE